ncbi:ABC transporter ATP-binding protein [uncultured Megasphaera sp.]|uniref:ABC transporter ATP-binding protein n=1 Tax=uncultured Megasphaera sp. TaxID=165188 RepID=UPI00259BB249|nr:ABC transporter ATP-binding protein [uncultured Megasphaera sp.]
MKAIIEVDNIDVYRQKRHVLQHISFTVAPGEIVAVIGPNGCGKSTLLQTLGRLLPYSKGNIYLYEQVLRQYTRKELARHIAILPQFHELPDMMTCRELVRLGRFPYHRFLRGLTSYDETWVTDSLKAVQMENMDNVLVRTLSGGEQQRIWLAVLLAQQAPILLLDEPTTYLDMYHQIHMMNVLRQACIERGLTIILVLHDMNQVLQFASRVLALKEGVIVAEGTPQEVITPALMRDIFGIRGERMATGDHSFAWIGKDIF